MKILLLACAITIGSLTTIQAQKAPVRKPAVKKPVAPQGLTLSQLSQIHALTDLPLVDEYLTARNWRYNKSITDDKITQVIYVHKAPNNIDDAGLYIFFCNTADNESCSYRAIHSDENRQHVYLTVYESKKSIFDNIKAKLRADMAPSASRVNSNSLTTIFDLKYYTAEFLVDNSSSVTEYRVLLRGKVDQTTTQAEADTTVHIK